MEEFSYLYGWYDNIFVAVYVCVFFSERIAIVVKGFCKNNRMSNFLIAIAKNIALQLGGYITVTNITHAHTHPHTHTLGISRILVYYDSFVAI